MTKKDLERENKFLRLQLKIINGLLEKVEDMDDTELHETIGAIMYYSDSEKFNENLKCIKEIDAPYNFYHKEMSI